VCSRYGRLVTDGETAATRAFIRELAAVTGAELADEVLAAAVAVLAAADAWQAADGVGQRIRRTGEQAWARARSAARP